MLRLYWGVRNWLRPGVIKRELTRDELLGWAALRKYPHAQKCLICHGRFWAVKGAEVCGNLDCYITYKHRRRIKQPAKLGKIPIADIRRAVKSAPPKRSKTGRGR